MSQLKEIDGRKYQDCKVVMLATNKKVTDKPFNVGITLCNDGKLRIGNPVGTSETRQNIYITSDEEIKEGDWIQRNDELPVLYTNDFWFDFGVQYKKIIATTDNLITVYRFNDDSDKLPQPSQQFIEKYIEEYNKGNVITDIYVRLISEWTTTIDEDGGDSTFEYVLKINSDNTIDIKLPLKKVKDSFSREEVIKLLKKITEEINYPGMYYESCNTEEEDKLQNDNNISKWIEKNL